MLRLSQIFKAGYVVTAIMLATVPLGSCDLAKNQLTFDRSANKDLQDYRDGLSPEKTSAAEPAPVLPEFQSVVSTPSDLKLPSPLVTVSVNQTVSLHDLMFELAEQAGVDLEMDPGIHGSIIFTAKDRPFNDVVDRICMMAGLRYTFENNVLRIELDRPYLKEYKVDYMSIARKSASDISTGISTSSAGGTGGGASASAGSNSKVDNANDADFWKDLEAGLKQLLAASDTATTLATQDDPVAVAEPPPPPPPPAPGAAAPAPPPASAVPPSLNVSVPASTKPAPNAASTYAISRETGVVSVFTSDRQQKLVQKFFDTYRRQSMTQILIEAKVLEVTLNDEFATGIDWGTLGPNLTRLITSAHASLPAPHFASADPTNSVFTANLDLAHGFKPIVQALSRYGTVRSLSSPRVTVMNNQSAVVNVATNLIYFNIKATVTPATQNSGPTISYDSTQQSVPDGVLLNVTPTANMETGEVILAVRPTVSKKVAEVNDPSVALNVIANGGNQAQIPQSAIPQMSVQEIDSIVKMQSGQTMVMGGLMKDANSVNQLGLPILGDVPLVGNLFRNHGDLVQKSELVIFLQASIVPGSTVGDTDRKVYKKFGNDTRPFHM